MKKVYLLRHGETEWTLSGQHTGRTDIDLTRNGRREAKRLGKTLKHITFDHVICSPLKRVRDTCRLAGFKDHILYDEGLIEWDYGDYEGITTKEIQKSNPEWTIFSQDPPGGETSQKVKERVDRLIEKVEKLDGENIALFSSGHISRVIGARWLNFPVSYGQYFVLSTASKSILGFEHGHRALLSWNDTSHLK